MAQDIIGAWIVCRNYVLVVVAFTTLSMRVILIAHLSAKVVEDLDEGIPKASTLDTVVNRDSSATTGVESAVRIKDKRRAVK